MGQKNNEKAKALIENNEREIIELLNGISQSVLNEVEVKRPVIKTNDNFDVLELRAKSYLLAKIEAEVNEMGYILYISENDEIKDATAGKKYNIFLSDYNNVYCKIDLLQYKHDIRDGKIVEATYWENILVTIDGVSLKKHKEVVEYIIEYIAISSSCRNFFVITYDTIGWEYRIVDNYKGWIFKYDHIFSSAFPPIRGRINLQYKDLFGTNSKLSDNEITEKKADWLVFTQQLLNHKHVEDCVLLGAGISGLIRQLLGRQKELGINLNVCGSPASGKTTICQFILSIFGSSELLEGSFVDTDNAREYIRSMRPVLPYVFDDRLLKDYEKSESRVASSFIFDIFREYNGATKERLGKQYEEQSGKPTYSALISSSVKSALQILLDQSAIGKEDVGQYRRFIEIYAKDSQDGVLFECIEEVNTASDFAKKYYGLGIEVIINYMLMKINNDSEVDYIGDRFNEIRDKYSEQIKNENLQGYRGDLMASVNKFSLIILSYQILRESILWCLETEYNTPNCEMGADRADEIFEFLKRNLIDKYKKKRDYEKRTDAGKRVYDYICDNQDYFIRNDSKLSHKEMVEMIEKEKQNGKYYIGYYTINASTVTVFTFEKYGIHHLWFLEKIPSASDIVNFIKEIDKLEICSAGELKNMLNKRFGIKSNMVSYNNKIVGRAFNEDEKKRYLRKFLDIFSVYQENMEEEEEN